MKKGTLAVLLVLIPALAIAQACALVYFMSPFTVKLPANQTIRAHWQQIGDELDRFYGSAWKDYEGAVKIPISLCVAGFCPGGPAQTVQILNKPCGMTLKEAAYAVAANANDGAVGGDVGDGSGDPFAWGGGTSNPWADCSTSVQGVKSCTYFSDGKHVCTEEVTVLNCPPV